MAENLQEDDARPGKGQGPGHQTINTIKNRGQVGRIQDLIERVVVTGTETGTEVGKTGLGVEIGTEIVTEKTGTKTTTRTKKIPPNQNHPKRKIGPFCPHRNQAAKETTESINDHAVGVGIRIGQTETAAGKTKRRQSRKTKRKTVTWC